MPKKIELPDILTTLETLSNEDLLKLISAADKEHEKRVKAAQLIISQAESDIELLKNGGK